MRPERVCSASVALAALLGLLLVIIGIPAYPENPYTGIIYVVIGVAQILVVGVLLGFARGKSGRDFGNVAVVGCWWILSVGIAALALFTSPLLVISTLYVAVSTVLAAIWVILGAVNIWLMVTRLGAEIVV